MHATIKEKQKAGVRHKSFKYHTAVEWTSGRSGRIEAEDRPSVDVSSPPEFRGEAGVWTPEDLFVAAVNTCTMTTFLAISEKAGFEVVGYRSDAEGTLEFSDGSFRFTRVVVRPTIIVADHLAIDTAMELIARAHDKCLVGNSIRAEVEIEPRIDVLGVAGD